MTDDDVMVSIEVNLLRNGRILTTVRPAWDCVERVADVLAIGALNFSVDSLIRERIRVSGAPR